MNCSLGFHKIKHPSYNVNTNFYNKKRSQFMSKSIMSSFAVGLLFISTKILYKNFFLGFNLGGIKCNNKLSLHIRIQTISDNIQVVNLL